MYPGVSCQERKRKIWKETNGCRRLPAGRVAHEGEAAAVCHTAGDRYVPRDGYSRACYWCFQVSTTIFASGLATLCFIFDHRAEDSAVLWLQLRLSDGDRQYVCGGGI